MRLTNTDDQSQVQRPPGYPGAPEQPIGFGGIRTRIIGVEGKHADQLTTATAQLTPYIFRQFFRISS